MNKLAKKLIDQKDILEDLIRVVTPKYFPNETLDRNRVSIYGYNTEALARSIEDTVTLEQRRAADYCPELSNSAIRVRQTAKIRGVNTYYAEPGQCFANIGILKSDIISKGTRVNNEIHFIIDRRSTIVHNSINFSLEDDIIIKAVQRRGNWIYSANYTGEHSTYESYIQMYEQTDSFGQEMITMICQIYQCNYNIQTKTVTDDVQFLYDGLEFDYDNLLADFEVYYKPSYSDEYIKLDKVHYLTTETTKAIYYNDDDDNILYILNNPALNIGLNSMIRVEIKETLGEDGMIQIGDDTTTFSLYRDGNYNYSGVNVYINMLSDTVDASDGDSLSDIKARLIDAKVRRDNITTEHDIISYINDIDANVQIVKKRNDIEDRRYYMYTLLRYNREIVPANTKRLKLLGIRKGVDNGEFDYYDQTVDRKVLRAYNKFRLVEPTDPSEEDYCLKVKREESIDNAFYFTCPFMIVVNDLDIASYYFSSVNTDIQVNTKTVNSMFPFQMIIRAVNIYRDSHDPDNFDTYRFTISGNMNTSNDSDLVDDEGVILDHEKIMAYIIFRNDDSAAAYLPMAIDSYDQSSRTFTFTATIKTNDYITELDKLQITEGLFKCGTDQPYDSVVDFKDAFFDVYFMYSTDEVTIDLYRTTDNIYQLLPASRTANYTLSCAYYNTPNNPYNLLLEYNKFTSSPVHIEPYVDPYAGTVNYYSIGEVPFIEYEYGIKHIKDMYDTFENMATVYGSLLKLTTDFDVSLKFIATYGHSKYITVTGGPSDGEDIVRDLNDLNPTFYFKVYGQDIDVEEIRNYIYEYLRDTYITGQTIFMSNICTLIEQTYSEVRSIKYMGVNDFDASYQEFNYEPPEFINIDIITRFVPEQLNVTDIQVDLDET